MKKKKEAAELEEKKKQEAKKKATATATVPPVDTVYGQLPDKKLTKEVLNCIVMKKTV
ncbi:hypothetical protein HCA60_02825 [Listeria booriae]|uniref:hypothetical protein n=1 Tax=Listeria booriae TaxID=1552123 RepID=UPI001629DA93|nr:hypothetical protein [Listeria booriae]MBC1811423.1 hypothetical protein [Listeria booriae]